MSHKKKPDSNKSDQLRLDQLHLSSEPVMDDSPSDGAWNKPMEDDDVSFKDHLDINSKESNEIRLDQLGFYEDRYSISGFDAPYAIKDKKEREFADLVRKYKNKWHKLKGNVSGNVANMIVTADRINPIRYIKSCLEPSNPNYFTIEAKELRVGCYNASDTTFEALALADYTLTYWNVAVINIPGHNATVVFDNEIGSKSTYVFDPWASQSPVYYSWEEWPFANKYRYIVTKIRYCASQRKRLQRR